ncbi:MAG: shikimate kinase [Chitinophagales bacterium]
MRIYLIGFMGSGKSTFGKKLSAKLGYDFIDIDKVIQELENMTVAEIFKKHGEDHFRKLESSVLHSTILEKEVVVSCGGGTPCYFDNMEWMNEQGLTIYLKMKPENLFGRLKEKKEKRPLIAKMSNPELKDYIFQKLSEREAFYLQAKMMINQDEIDLKERIDLVRRKIQERG